MVACLVILGCLFISNFQPAKAEETFQTWPSRTPTPDSGPINPPGGQTPGGGELPTETAEATAVVPGTLTPIPAQSSPSPAAVSPGIGTGSSPEGVPEEGQVLEDESRGCEIPPSVRATGRIEVRDAPGVDGLVIGFLETAETRLIIGRSEFAPWWFIQFTADLQGWVTDLEVSILGYTGYVPIILTSQETPLAEATWNPTPNPICTPEPVATTASLTEQLADEQNGNQGEDATTGQVEAASGSSAGQVDEATPASDQAAVTPEGSEDEQSQPSYLWLLITGAFLIVAGALTLLLRRQSS